MFNVYFLYGATRWYLTFTLTFPFLLQIFDFMTELYSVHFLCHGATEWVWGRFCAATVFEIIFSENHGTSHPSDGQSNSVHAFEAELKIEGYANQHYKDRISLSSYISIHKWQIGMLSTEKSHIVLCKNFLILLLPVDWLYLWVCHSRQIVVLQVWCNIATWDSVTLR